MSDQPNDAHTLRSLRIESDLRGDGTFGPSALVSDGVRLWREIDGRVDAEWQLDSLKNIDYEEIVDAGRIVARHDNLTIELIRGSAATTSVLSAGAKDINLVANGLPPQTIGDTRRRCPKCHRPLPADSDVCDYCINRGQTLLRLFRFVKPYRWQVALSTLLLLGGTAMTLLPGLLIKELVDDVFEQGNRHRFLPVILMMVGASLALMTLTMLRGWINAWIGNRVTVDIRSRLFQHFQALSR
jgi:ATP-binding cassette subfamily B protein